MLSKMVQCIEKVHSTRKTIIDLQNQQSLQMKQVTREGNNVEGFRKKLESDISNAKTGAAVTGGVGLAAVGGTLALASGPVGWLAFGVSALTTVIASKSYVDNADKLVDASRQQLRDAKEDLEKDKRRFSQLENSIRNNQTDYDDEVLLAQVFMKYLHENPNKLVLIKGGKIIP